MRVRALCLVVTVATVLALGQGIAEARPIDPPPGARTVTTGAPCSASEAGDVGQTGSGEAMFCAKAPGDPVLRWRTLDSATHRLVGAIDRLYSAYFVDEPDGAGFAYWINLRMDGVPLAVISEHFSWSLQFFGTGFVRDQTGFVSFVFRVTLGRQPTIPEWDFWVRALAAGYVTRGQMMVQFSQSPEFRTATGTV